MPRKPNYGFERSERNRIKAEKKAARLAAKQEKAEARKTEEEQAPGTTEAESPKPSGD